jgi:transcriptional regulator GlxA family with amidase domain
VLHETHSVDERAYSKRATRRSRVFLELWQARCLQGYVAVHLHSKIKLADLAKVTDLSRYEFNRIFKASFGCTPGHFVKRMRIARAQNLMTMSSDPLRQIAMECGFADQPHFNHCFRKVVGESPAIWRARRCKSLQTTQCGDQEALEVSGTPDRNRHPEKQSSAVDPQQSVRQYRQIPT